MSETDDEIGQLQTLLTAALPLLEKAVEDTAPLFAHELREMAGRIRGCPFALSNTEPDAQLPPAPRHVQIFDVASERDVICTDNEMVMIHAGLDERGVKLLAESFALDREKWDGKAVVLVGYGRDEQPVYISVSSQAPKVLEAPDNA